MFRYEIVYWKKNGEFTKRKTKDYSLWKINIKENKQLFLGGFIDNKKIEDSDGIWDDYVMTGCETNITEEEVFTELL